MSRKSEKKRRGLKILAGIVIFIGIACVAAGLAWNRDSLKETTGKLQADIKQTITKKLIDYQEAGFDEAELTDRFHYSLLTEEEKVTYREIVQGLRDGAGEITVHAGKAEEANRIYELVFRDFPEFFFCDGAVSTTAYAEAPGRDAYCVMSPNYVYEGEERERRGKEIESAAEACLSQIPAEASEYEKIRFVFDYLANTIEYQQDSPDDQNIYSALVNRVSVCNGYAKGMQYLLGRLGIPCIYVSGEATDSNGETDSHAWNLVRCDGDYYCVDVTWGDQSSLEDAQTALDRINYTYLCCTGAELAKSHKADMDFPYPECTADRYNYYKMNGMYFDYFDYDAYMQVIRQDIDQGEACTVFKFSDEALYSQAHDMLTSTMVEEGAQYLGQIYGLPQVNYASRESAFQNSIILYWYYS